MTEYKFKPGRRLGKMTPVVGSFIYRGEVSIGAAGPYIGKTRLSLSLSDKLSRGQSTMFGDAPPLKVLFCAERGWNLNSEQIRSVGLEEINDNFRSFCVPDIPEKEILLFHSNPLDYIEKKEISSEWKPDLVIFDTAPQFQPAVPGKEVTNSYSFNRIELLKWKRWAERHNCGVFGIYHSPKQNENTRYDDPFERVLGSQAILGSTVAVCILEKYKPDETKVLVHFKSHVSLLRTPRLFSLSDFSEVLDVLETPQLREGDQEVLEKISAEPQILKNAVYSLQEETKKSRATIYRAIAKLQKSQLISIFEDEDTGTTYIKRLKLN